MIVMIMFVGRYADRTLMKMELRYLLLFSMFLCHCSSGTSTPIEENFSEWLEEHRIQPNEKLLEFSYSNSDKDNAVPLNVEYYSSKDTLVVWFYSTQPVGCLIIGDIELYSDTIELKIGQACDPFSDQIVAEEADLKFVYKIVDAQIATTKTFIIREYVDLIKQ